MVIPGVHLFGLAPTFHLFGPTLLVISEFLDSPQSLDPGHPGRRVPDVPLLNCNGRRKATPTFGGRLLDATPTLSWMSTYER